MVQRKVFMGVPYYKDEYGNWIVEQHEGHPFVVALDDSAGRFIKSANTERASKNYIKWLTGRR